MKLDKILQYQKVDQELIAIENTVSKSEERQRVALAKAKVEQATDMIGKLKSEAAELLSGYTALRDKLDALKAELAEFDGIIDGVQDTTEAEHYLKLVTAISEKIAALEKETVAASLRIDQISGAYKKTWEQGVKATEVFKTAKAEYDALVKQYQPKVTEIKAELEKLKADIPPQFMNVYLSLRAAKKMPAFVAFDPSQSQCGRCFMEVPNDTKSKLRNPGDCAECPNCRRVLYVAET